MVKILLNLLLWKWILSTIDPDPIHASEDIWNKDWIRYFIAWSIGIIYKIKRSASPVVIVMGLRQEIPKLVLLSQVFYFTKEFNPSLAKPPLDSNGGLANLGLTSSI